ncbi:MAG: protein-glutamate O-methyltransferase CheR [Candidatus Rokubacteria bacterium]|nr:protein-glutamate O-methyltransferase CheR [Candidatus Rokubacteria bacterium]
MPPVAGEAVALPGQFVITDREFQRFRALVYEQTGIALTDTKRQLVCSRLGRRLRYYGYATFSQYYQHLVERDPEGQEILRMVNAITTNKTDFFREGHHFDFLRSEVLAPLAARAGAPRSLRIWSAGCSSGEEPYSIAITVLEAFGALRLWDVRILASDIDTEMLAIANAGVYPAERAAPVPRALRDRYFLKGRGAQEGLVRVRREVQELVDFRRINLREDAWPIRTLLDCVFCRNVIIYFDRPLQQRVVARLAETLKPGGYLFLGHSESLLGMRVGLRHLRNTVYQKVDDALGVVER